MYLNKILFSHPTAVKGNIILTYLGITVINQVKERASIYQCNQDHNVPEEEKNQVVEPYTKVLWQQQVPYHARNLNFKIYQI